MTWHNSTSATINRRGTQDDGTWLAYQMGRPDWLDQLEGNTESLLETLKSKPRKLPKSPPAAK
jgi:hypothetical protein